MEKEEILNAAKSLVENIVEKIKDSKDLHIISHIDCDGICSAAILGQLCKHLSKQFTITCIKQLNEDTILEVKKITKKNDLIIFTDLGSGQQRLIETHLSVPSIVIDHHIPQNVEENKTIIYHLNAHNIGLDGSFEVSGATLCYLISQKLNLYESSQFALVGCLGDLQDRKYGKLVGWNKYVAEDAIEHNIAQKVKGVSFFGRETRPLRHLLLYASSPYLPGLSGREEACSQFLEDIGIEQRDGTLWRAYHDLSTDEKNTFHASLLSYAIENNVSPWGQKMLLKEYFIFPNAPRHSELRDATESTTLLNACGRWGEADTGVQLCMGEEGYYNKAKTLLERHRRKLREGLEELNDNGIDYTGKYVQYYIAKEIDPSIIGIIIGMALGSRIANPNRIILGFSLDGEKYKVSARTTQFLVKRGVNLARSLKYATQGIGGEGGGHDIAAGAYIFKEHIDLFLKNMDQLTTMQLKGEPIESFETEFNKPTTENNQNLMKLKPISGQTSLFSFEK